MPAARRSLRGFSRSFCQAASRSAIRRVGVVGAGPSGFYLTKYLLKELGQDAQVHIIEKLPTPYGLVRSGVAPDHPEVKSVQADFKNVAQDTRFRYFGNVTVGVELSMDQLRSLYDVVVMAYGASEDRRLGIPGEDLKGVLGARHLVNWYNGHPDYAGDASITDIVTRRLTSRQEGAQVVVLGQGNVALDCARILAKSASSLASTDICEHALGVLRESKVKEVAVVGRRGHVQAAFTIKEIRELTRVEGAAVMVDRGEVERGSTDASREEMQQRARKRLTELVEGLPSRDAPVGDDVRTRVALRFLLLPRAFLPDAKERGCVGAVVMEKARLEGPAGKQVAVGTGEMVEIPCQVALRSIGYRSLPIPGLPFDERRAVLKQDRGRVMDGETPVPGVYCTGWVKRGPSGIIVTNIIDARDTVASIMEDQASGRLPQAPDVDVDPMEVLKGGEVVTWDKYRRLEECESKRGAAKGKPREKIIDTNEMLRVASGQLVC